MKNDAESFRAFQKKILIGENPVLAYGPVKFSKPGQKTQKRRKRNVNLTEMYLLLVVYNSVERVSHNVDKIAVHDMEGRALEKPIFKVYFVLCFNIYCFSKTEDLFSINIKIQTNLLPHRCLASKNSLFRSTNAGKKVFSAS